jgi:hypothetical protein
MKKSVIAGGDAPEPASVKRYRNATLGNFGLFTIFVEVLD